MRKQLLHLLSLLHRPATPSRVAAGQCVYCGYDLRADRRHPNYCPQCGSSQLQEAHIYRRREIMLEIERLHLELVRNHQQERIFRLRKN